MCNGHCNGSFKGDNSILWVAEVYFDKNIALIRTMSSMPSRYKLAALYKFTVIDDVEVFKIKLTGLAMDLDITGALILATEGINGTIAGSEGNLDVMINTLLSDPKFDGLEIKYSYTDEKPFYRMRICIKNEIVTMGCPNIDPAGELQGTYVEPEDWNAIIEDPEVLVIDTRNDYEYRIGTFKNAINPKTENFKDFPAYVKDNLNTDVHKKVAMFCTGGIRCEKASIYMRQQGFETVYNLKGGILKYLEKVDESATTWNGECFVFDQRVSVTHGLQQGSCVFCRGCRAPLTPEEVQSPQYEEGISCPYCIDGLTDDKRRAKEERNLQIKLMEQRNEQHIGYKHPKDVRAKRQQIEEASIRIKTSDVENI